MEGAGLAAWRAEAWPLLPLRGEIAAAQQERGAAAQRQTPVQISSSTPCSRQPLWAVLPAHHSISAGKFHYIPSSLKGLSHGGLDVAAPVFLSSSALLELLAAPAAAAERSHPRRCDAQSAALLRHHRQSRLAQLLLWRGPADAGAAGSAAGAGFAGQSGQECAADAAADEERKRKDGGWLGIGNLNPVQFQQ